jgi:MFS family permease
MVAEKTISSSAGRNVLAALDHRAPTRFYWSLTLLATLGGFLFGYDTANIGSALNFVPYHLTGFANGYLVSGASLGAAAGAILGGPAADRFGRKALLIVDALIYAIGAIGSAVTPNAAILLASRTLIGLAIGADSAIATAYIAEYAPRGRRGSLSMLQQWMITVGILVAYIVAGPCGESLLGGVLGLLAGLLQVALHLLALALGFQHRVSDGLAGGLLDLALGRLGLALGLLRGTHCSSFLCFGRLGPLPARSDP